MSGVPGLEQVKSYFGKRIEQHGASPRGVDWNSAESQKTRFDQLLKIIETPSFSILDYGCGYGALADYMEQKGLRADYYGFDILESAIAIARRMQQGKPNRTFLTDPAQAPVCDYVVASGVFNVRGEESFETWTAYVLDHLQRFNELSRKGFGSNFLTKYSDADRMRADLYYADPLYLFDYCKRRFSRNVALLHDYRIYDFTILVRKD
ncbi:MAG TPA: class I SAM-dependent methyltransferase [Anaerolineales bacterium]|nr:class I SAM-dependent methyltransferase [Anaerolineales bacterium]